MELAVEFHGRIIGEVLTDAPVSVRLERRVYSMVEVSYRNGQSETFPPDYYFASDTSDPRVLWIVDSIGPVARRSLGEISSISLKEVAA